MVTQVLVSPELSSPVSLFFCNAYREHDARRCPGCKRKREGAEEREREHGERRAMMVSRRRCRRRRRRRNRQAAKCSLALPLLSALAARGASALQAPRGDHGSRACDSKKRTRARVCARERERERESLSLLPAPSLKSGRGDEEKKSAHWGASSPTHFSSSSP